MPDLLWLCTSFSRAKALEQQPPNIRESVNIHSWIEIFTIAFAAAFTISRKTMQQVIVDFGSSFCKFGISGESYPRYIISSNQQQPALGLDFRGLEDHELEQAVYQIFKRIKQQLMIFDESNKKIVMCEDVMMPISLKRAILQVVFTKFSVS